MKLAGKKDLRIDRTQQSIRNALTELLQEMPFGKITVTELSRRANINKKTFYRHYASLEGLLEEIQHEFSEPFAARTSGLHYPQDVDAITREFLLYSAEQGPLYDAMASNDMHEQLFAKMMDEMGAERTSSSTPPQGWTNGEWSIYLSHVVSSQVHVYRRWVKDGRIVPVNRMVTLGVRLVCDGAYLEKSWRDDASAPLPPR